MTQSRAAKQWAASGTLFAGVLMILLGIWQALAGIAAIIDDDFLVAVNGYVYDINTTAWGWIHLIVGALVAVAGISVFSGQVWARGVGVIMASLSAIGNFLFLPYYPVWSIVMIAIAVFVIWSLITWSPKDIDRIT